MALCFVICLQRYNKKREIKTFRRKNATRLQNFCHTFAPRTNKRLKKTCHTNIMNTIITSARPAGTTMSIIMSIIMNIIMNITMSTIMNTITNTIMV